MLPPFSTLIGVPVRFAMPGRGGQRKDTVVNMKGNIIKKAPDQAELARMQGFMALALEEAKAAAEEGEVPVGAVLVHRGQVIARGHNLRESGKNALLHAEMIVIGEGCRLLGGWRLPDCELYVTLEPCPMCAGAVVNSRVGKVVFGGKDYRAGAFGSVLNLNGYPLNHKPEVVAGVMEGACLAVLKAFFEERRR